MFQLITESQNLKIFTYVEKEQHGIYSSVIVLPIIKVHTGAELPWG